MRKINKIIVHCTANRPNCKMKALDFRKLRQQTKCGYHFIVFEDGTWFNDVPVEIVANHCRFHNADSIGIAYVGGLDANNVTADTRTPAQKKTLRFLLKQLLRRFPVPIYGHRHFNNGKVCPCFDADAEYKDLLHEVEK